MSQNNINTAVLQQFINQVKSADLAHQREIKLDITTAKNLSYTLALVMTRVIGNYEGLLQKQNKDDEVISVQMDGGSWEKN